MEQLLEAVKSKDKDLAAQWASSEHWATVEQIMQAHGKTCEQEWCAWKVYHGSCGEIVQQWSLGVF